MDIASLIASLAKPSAYPFPVANVAVHQTHISAVFLAGDFASKIKKPVRLPFLDFSTIELRRRFCDEEVRLNRRLAPDVYLGVVPVTVDGNEARFEGAGSPIDWAVKMRRLPESATLEQHVLRDEVNADDVRRLAVRLATFHATAARSPHIASFGRFDAVAKNIRENFSISAPLTGTTISPEVRGRLMELTEGTLEMLRPLIDARAERGVPCDTHGDLHLDHVYLFPNRPAPADLVVVDCIEFNERFRYTDPVADMAFLAMDLEFHGRRDLATAFAQAYFDASGDEEGRALLPLYVSYRAAVRGKVDGLQLVEPEIPQESRDQALVRARGHWLLALNALEQPSRRACLVLVGGLPGTGKSTLAAALAGRGSFEVIRSDVVRKELAGLKSVDSGRSAFGEGIYSTEWTDRTYAECLRRAEEKLFAGGRVIVDASFSSEQRRRQFIDAAVRHGVPVVLLICDAPPATVKSRLDRRVGDASDADWSVYEEAAARWEPPTTTTERLTRSISTGGPSEESEAHAWNSMRDAGLVS
jgi:aminoglycoside phosphotransferase family enzyme/predicted kinase